MFVSLTKMKQMKQMTKMKKRRLADEAEEEDEDKGEIACVGSSVYFHTHIEKKTVLEFIKRVREAVEYASKTQTFLEERRIYVYIHSEGGDAFSGLSAMNHLRNCPCKVTTIIDGFCASAATLMFLGGSQRFTRGPPELANQHAFRTPSAAAKLARFD